MKSTPVPLTPTPEKIEYYVCVEMIYCHFSPQFPSCRAIEQTLSFITILAQSWGWAAR